MVNVYDEKIEHENEVFRKYLRFRDYDFEDVCKNAAYDVILGWKSLPDENMLESLKSEIIKQAAIYDEDDDDGYDIDVDIEYEEDNGEHILHVYITRFEDYDSSGRYDGYDILIDDYIRFDDNISTDVDTFNVDDIDLDISDFFFKD